MTDTRATLVEATRELLWERGYAATSPKAILARAGVGQGSMYHHFAGKEALAHEAFEANAEWVHERALAVLAGAGTPVQRLVGYLEVQREVLRGCPVGRMAGDVEVAASPTLHDVLRETFERLRSLVVDTVAEGVRSGELRADVVPAELAETVLAVVQGGYVLARAAADPAPFDRAVRGAMALVESVRA